MGETSQRKRQFADRINPRTRRHQSRDRRRTPNQALQQTGHANDASSCHYANFRVSRLLSWLFGERRTECGSTEQLS